MEQYLGVGGVEDMMKYAQSVYQATIDEGAKGDVHLKLKLPLSFF